MHTALLNRIFIEHGISHCPQEQEQFIHSLREPAKRIWKSFRTDTVQMDYSNRTTQECYLLRYYLPNSQLIRRVLHQCKYRIKPRHNQLTASLFGCGPAPELLGIMQYLQSTDQSREPLFLSANLFDIANEYWQYGRNISHNALLQTQWNPNLLNISTHTADLTDPSLLQQPSTVDAVSCSQLVVIQNCLNEMTGSAVTRNIDAILEAMPTGGILVLIDLKNYRAAQQACRHIDMHLPSYFQCRASANDDIYETRHINNNLPKQIREHLFYTNTRITEQNNGLILANQIQFCWRVVLKA